MKSLDRQMRKLIEMRATELITEGEFRQERAALLARRSTLEQRLVYEVCSPEQVQADMAEIAQPLQDVLGTWRTVPTQLRRRFVQFILPVGFVRGEVRTAELGLLFRVFGTSPNGVSSAGTLVSASWNRFWQEIQAFLGFLQEWQDQAECSKEAVRTESEK